LPTLSLPVHIAAGRYYATQVEYEPSNPNFNLDNMADALDQLYITQNTTISNLNNQVTTLTGQVSAKDATISDLQLQVESLTAAASEKDYVTGTFTFPSSCNKNYNLGFRSSKLVVYYNSELSGCIISYNGGDKYSVAIANGDVGWVSTKTNEDWYFAITQSGFKAFDVPDWSLVANKTFTYIAFR